MTLRIPNEGEARLLGMALGKIAPEPLWIRLFANNMTPAETDTTASYTEVSGHGYGEQALTAASWELTEGAPTEATHPQMEWIFTGEAGAVYGYYIVGESSGKVLWAERFSDGPYVINLDGDRIRVTPKITLQDTLD